MKYYGVLIILMGVSNGFCSEIKRFGENLVHEENYKTNRSMLKEFLKAHIKQFEIGKKEPDVNSSYAQEGNIVILPDPHAGDRLQDDSETSRPTYKDYICDPVCNMMFFNEPQVITWLNYDYDLRVGYALLAEIIFTNDERVAPECEKFIENYEALEELEFEGCDAAKQLMFGFQKAEAILNLCEEYSQFIIDKAEICESFTFGWLIVLSLITLLSKRWL